MTKVKRISRRKMLDFDLQLFGGGGDGKSGGKLLGTVAFGVLGFYFGGALFGAAKWGGAMLGASLFSSVWTAFNTPKASSSSSSSTPTIQRFDKSQESMSSQASIPIVYGKRLITGNQTYHETNADLTQLHKHVVLCEGGINKIVSITANGLLVPTGTQTSNTVFTIQNLQDKNATVSLSGKVLTLHGGGIHKSLYLASKSDFESGNTDTLWEYQINISTLVSYLNRLGHGWECFPTASTNKYPGDLYDTSGNCYKNPINFNAGTVTGGTSYTFHDCQSPSIYDTTGGYPKMAWLDMRFYSSSELNGNPSVECVVEGRKLYDMRNGETKYSTNPALCVWDFLTNKRYGLGRWITTNDLDTDSFIESANYCDEIINFQNSDGSIESAKRYELNMIIDERQDALTWLQNMLANFSGFLVYSQGKLKLCIEKASPVRYKFDDSNIKELQIAPLKLSETPNKYSVSLVDPLNNWKVINAVVEDFADQKQRGRIIEKQIELEGVTSQHQALRLARFYRDYNLVCPIQLSFTTGVEAMHLEPGDVVIITYRDVFKELPIRIAEIKETEDNNFEISGRQYNETLYTDELGGGIHWYDYTTATGTEHYSPSGSSDVSAVSDLSAASSYTCINGTYEYVINVAFTLPKNATKADVYYKVNSAIAEDIVISDLNTPADELGYKTTDWIYAGEAVQNLRIDNVNLGDTYQIKVLAKDSDDNKSKPSVTSVVVSKRELVPSQPCNFTFDAANLKFSWNDVADSDAMYYEVRTDTNTGITVGLLGRTNSTFLIAKSLPRKGTAYLYAINNQKHYSLPVEVSWHVPYPEKPLITQREMVKGVSLSASNWSNSYKGIIFNIVGTDYNESITSETGTFLLNGNAGIYEVEAAFVDVFGLGLTCDKVLVTVKPTFSAEWIEDGTLSIDKVDESVQEALADGHYAKKQITQIIAATDEDAKKGTNYSAITQLADAINFRVKGENLINQINMTEKGTTIDGQYLHVTGDTQFDKNVIVGGMISAGAITADKLSSEVITLKDKQGIGSDSVVLDASGLSCSASDGSKVLFNNSGMNFVDANGKSYAHVGRMIMGTANHGQRVRFTTPWTSIPTVLLTPISQPLTLADYTSQNTYTDIGAISVTREGFTVKCRTVMNGGTGVVKTGSYSTGSASASSASSGNLLPSNCTSGTISITNVVERYSSSNQGGGGRYTIIASLNGNAILNYTYGHSTGGCSTSGSKVASFTCSTNSTLTLTTTWTYGGYYEPQGCDTSWQLSWKASGLTEIAHGDVMFIAIENNNASYSIS